MQSQCENIYKVARKIAGLTQNEASELLFISPRTLSEYENGRLIPLRSVRSSRKVKKGIKRCGKAQ